ncbi:hypothetical protein NEHOM01_1213 [Nematocida homosporus]|uniref:uncharacterized protein n=1 Tax=Nematocida homosporus TaxID=1912981 RepID=UPI00222064DC|nr:uncharacterized protein NEHOM01_1213 [Nematocida homosporus]KAI5186010.1 hypothetical protein NEHOM01_1213 [Nematocida homosporus]
MKRKRSTPNERQKPFSKLLQYIRHISLLCYYRYSVEIGISTMEGWEAFIVNSIFLLLLVSILKQATKGIIILSSFIQTSFPSLSTLPAFISNYWPS